MKICAINTDNKACGNYRIKIPFEALKKDGLDITVFSFDKVTDIKLLLQYDVIILQRIIDPKVLNIVKILLNNKKIIIHEIDDNLFEVNKNNPAHKTFNKKSEATKIFTEASKICSYIFTTTETLAKELNKYLKLDIAKYKWFNNALDMSNPVYQNSLRNKIEPNKIIIGFQGGSGHQDDIDYIIEPVKYIVNKYDNVIFAFIGQPDYFDKFNLKRDKAIHIPFTNDFRTFMNFPSYFDIGLAPLCHKDNFNISKSYLKILEFGAFKIPTICSNVGDFKNFDKDSVILTDNSFLSWVTNIEKLINDVVLRKEIGLNAYKNISEGVYSLKHINNARKQFFKEVENENFIIGR